jgi:hypothetical protein
MPTTEHLASRTGCISFLKRIETDMFARRATLVRVLGLDTLDWLLLLLGVALTGMLVVLV